jgi:hypothetical protein
MGQEERVVATDSRRDDVIGTSPGRNWYLRAATIALPSSKLKFSSPTVNSGAAKSRCQRR